MRNQSLIPSFEEIQLHALDLSADEAINVLNKEIQSFRNLANPLVCDEKYLPFLAYAFKVDFWDERLEVSKKRSLIKESILLHQKKGTLWAVKRVLQILEVDAEISEWFQYGGSPYFFRIKLSIEQDFPHINQLQKLIDIYKNVRSLYEIDFDLFLEMPFFIKTATNTRLEIDESIKFYKESETTITFACNYDFDAFEIIRLEKEINCVLTSSNIADIEIFEDAFDVERNTFITPKAQSITNLHFGGIGSDVMHLPIPPILLSTKIIDGANLIMNMDFQDKNTSDLFHLDYHKLYEASSQFTLYSFSKTGLEFQDSGINTQINVEANMNNICFLNLNI